MRATIDDSIALAASTSCDYTEWLNFTPVQVGADFFTNLDRCRDDGEKILLFMETAKRSDVPLRAIAFLMGHLDAVVTWQPDWLTTLRR